MNKTIYALKSLHGIARRRIKNIVIYTTNRCNSRCKTCYIWKKQPKTDIPIEIINKLLNDKISKGVVFRITGGEFLLHPKHKEILSLFNQSGNNYHIFSNCVLVDSVIETVREFKVTNLIISCDGIGAKYKEIRGVDNFKNIVHIVNELKDEINITLNYTISPLNSKNDLKHVIDFANSKNVKLVIGIYNNLEYFDTNLHKQKAYDLNGITVKGSHVPKKFIDKYIELYNKWLEGKYRIPCLNIRSQIAVYPNGEVHLCEGKNTILGDLNKNSLISIWNSEKTIQLQKQSKDCNDCFLTCQRPFDIIINSTPLKWLIK